MEKALFDTLYLSTRKNRRFARLPELELADAGFQDKRYVALVRQHPLPPPIATAMQRRFERLSSGETAGARQ